jgi:hypothetical protein
VSEHSIKVYCFADVGDPYEPNDAAWSRNRDGKIEGGFQADAFCYRLGTASSHL